MSVLQKFNSKQSNVRASGVQRIGSDVDGVGSE